jgi:O-antigen/teichoic acid export membrane protein
MITASLRNLFLKNAAANVMGGAGSALFNLLLPALVIRYIGKLEFSVWTLALQILMYLQIFGFGLQTAITKFIAHGSGGGDFSDQKKTIKAGLVLVFGFVSAAMAMVVILVIFYPLLFKNIPADLVTEFRICIGLLGMSAAWQLFALVPNGMFVGLHRNIIPVGCTLFVRMLSLLTLWLVLKQGGGLLALSITLAACGGILVPTSYFCAHRWASNLVKHLGETDWSRVKQLFNYCASLAVWNLAMLFVNGVDMIIIGHFDFEKVAAYSLAVTSIAVLVGVLQAVLNPLVAIGSSAHASAETAKKLPNILFLSSISCAAFLIFVYILFLYFGRYILGFWVSPIYVDDVYRFLLVLLISHAVRNLMMPFSILLVAIAEHRKAFLPAVTEGIVNLCFSLVLVAKVGAIGVAYATLIGALAGVICSFVLVVNKTKVLTISRCSFFYKILLLPLSILLVLFFVSFRMIHGNG